MMRTDFAAQIRPLLDDQASIGLTTYAYALLALGMAALDVLLWRDLWQKRRRGPERTPPPGLTRMRAVWRALADSDVQQALGAALAVPALMLIGLIPYGVVQHEVSVRAGQVAVAVTDPGVRIADNEGHGVRLVRPQPALIFRGTRVPQADAVLTLSRAEVARLNAALPTQMTALAAR